MLNMDWNVWTDAFSMAATVAFAVTAVLAIRGDRDIDLVGAMVLGLITAIGGGLIRDMLAGPTTLLMRPELYATPVLLGCTAFVLVLEYLPQYRTLGGIICIITASLLQTPAGAAVFPDGGYSAAMAAKGIPTPAPYQIVAALVDKMLEKGYSETDCGKFLGGNMYRVMKQVWI